MNIVHQPPKALLLLRLTVENASIISSHLTYGMPSPTAFVGFGHALQRKLNATAAYQSLQIVGVGVACHAFYPQITQTNTGFHISSLNKYIGAYYLGKNCLGGDKQKE